MGQVSRDVPVRDAGFGEFVPVRSGHVGILARFSDDPDPNPGVDALIENEQPLLEWIANGFPGREIANMPGLAEKTVRNHLTRVFEKLGVATRTEAALWFEKRRTGKT